MTPFRSDPPSPIAPLVLPEDLTQQGHITAKQEATEETEMTDSESSPFPLVASCSEATHFS
jgi:hypothetical protein